MIPAPGLRRNGGAKGGPVSSTVLTKATLSLLELACEAVPRAGAVGLLLMPEGPMDWDAVRALAGGVRVLVAVESDRQEEAVKRGRAGAPWPSSRPRRRSPSGSPWP